MQILYYEKRGSDFAPMNGIWPSLTPRLENLWQAQNHRPSADPVGTLAQRESHWLTNETQRYPQRRNMNIYVASSWRNERQPAVVERLKAEGHDVYDFRNPKEHIHERDAGFHWSDIDSEWMSWTPKQFIDALDHPLAEAGFKSDMDGLTNAEVLVLVMPCGRSAHLEMGYAAGAGIPTIILMSDGEPELMYRMATRFAIDLDGVVESLKAIESGARS